MTAPAIGFQDGIEATRIRLNTIDPGKAAYDKQAATLETLKDGHNAVWGADGLAAQVSELRRQLQLGPFS